MDAAPKPALGDATNAPQQPFGKSPTRPADEPVAQQVGPTATPPRPPVLAARLLPAPPAAPPKKAQSAVSYYMRATRDKIEDEHPDWEIGDVCSELLTRWKALDDDAKRPFKKLAAADKERFKREKAAYDAANPPARVVVKSAPSAPSAPPPRKRKKPPTKEVPLDEDQDWTLKNQGKQVVHAFTGEPVKRAKKVPKNPTGGEFTGLGRGANNIGKRWGRAAKAPKFIECEEGVAYKPGPAVPGAKELWGEYVPQECLGYPVYKKGQGRDFFRKRGDFYNANGYWKLKVYKAGGYQGKKVVYKFFKEVERA